MNITIPADTLLDVFDHHTWTQGTYVDGDRMCLHGMTRVCAPVPGDAQLIERVANRYGWGTGWNDAKGRKAGEVRDLLAHGIEVTDGQLAATFGPQWAAVVSLVRRAAALTPDEAQRLDAARAAARAAAVDAAWAAAVDAAWDAAVDAARDAAWAAARAAARDAARAVVTWDLASSDGPYTFAHRDLLIGPWQTVCGLPAGLLDLT